MATGPEHEREASDWSRRRKAFFEEQVTRLMDRLYGTALRLTRDPDDAEDIVAETVSRAWSRLDSLREPERFEGWIFHILHNTFVSAWRHRKYRGRFETSPEDERAGDDAGEEEFSLFRKLHQPFLLWWGTPENEFLNELLREDIQRAIDSLPATFRVAVVLVEIEGYTYQEVADLLEVPLGTVRSRLYRGRALLQRALWEQARDAGLTSAGTSGNPGTGGHR